MPLRLQKTIRRKKWCSWVWDLKPPLPTIAASVLSAQAMRLPNFSVISAHKQVVPALNALMQTKEVKIDGFLLPGHVSVIIGAAAYRGFVQEQPDSLCDNRF